MAHERMPFFHGVTDQLPDREEHGGHEAAPMHDKGEAKGDGLHHHEIHEDEGGGFHSKHTAPDGKVTHADHATYAEAKDHMDAMHGESAQDEKDEEPGREASDDLDVADGGDDIAGDYGRAGCK